MPTSQPNIQIKYLKYLAVSLFLFYIVFATFFYFERLNSDCGYYFFQTVNKNHIHVEHGRYVLAIAEFPLYLGVLMHLPLKILAILFSLTHVFFHFIIARFIYKKYKQLIPAFTIILLQFIGLRESIFTPQFELYYGLSFVVLALVIFQQECNLISVNFGILKTTIVLIISLFFGFTSHPFAIILFFIGLLLINIYNQKLNLQSWIISFTVLGLYVIWKKNTVSDYESGKFTQIFTAIKNGNFFNVLKPTEFAQSFSLIYTKFIDTWVIYLLVFISLIIQKKFLQVMVIVGLYFLLQAIIWNLFSAHPNIDRYIEQVYFPISFLACVHFIYLKNNINFKVLFSVFCILFVYKFAQFIEHGNRFRTRANQMKELILVAKQSNYQKAFVEPQSMNNLYEKGIWSFGFETLIYSVIHCNKSITVTKKVDLEFDDNFKKLTKDQWLFRQWEREEVSKMNKTYFHLPSNYNYQLIKYNSKLTWEETFLP